VGHLIEFLEWRQATLEGASDALKGLEDLGRQLVGRPWRAGRRFSLLLGELVDYTALNEDVDDRLARNRERRRRVERLHASRLYRTAGPPAGRASRRATPDQPAHVPRRLPAGGPDVAGVGAGQPRGRAGRLVSPRRLCDSYGEFVTLLVARSLATLGYRAVTPHVPAAGGPDVHYAGPDGDTLALRCGADGTLAVQRDADPLAVFVPLPHPLTADSEATDLRTLVDGLDRSRRPGGPLRVVVYPGTRAELGDLRSISPWRADTVGNDLPGGPGVGLLPQCH
jgi:hypothetical protein